MKLLENLVIELRNEGIREEAIFERVNNVLLRSSRKRENKKDGVKKYRKKPVETSIVCVGFIL